MADAIGIWRFLASSETSMQIAASFIVAAGSTAGSLVAIKG
jgi:hypothetical protein